MDGNELLKVDESVNAEEGNHLKWINFDKSSEVDPCDCPREDCPGCWFPCETCGSTKCSSFCRKMRKDKILQWARTH